MKSRSLQAGLSMIIAAGLVTLAGAGAGAEPRDMAFQANPARDAATAEYQAIPPFDIKDVFGRIIKVQDLEGWITVYGFGDKDNADVATNWFMELTREFAEVDGILYVAVADTSEYSGRLLQPIARTVMGNEYKDYVERIERFLDELGADYNYAVDRRYVLVPDMDGAIFDLFGLGEHKGRPHLFVVDAERRAIGRYTEYSEAMVHALRRAVDERDGIGGINIRMRRDPRKTVKKLVILGAGLFFMFR